MKVMLKRNWFSPDGAFYKADENPHLIDDSMKPFLPRDAKVLGPTDVVPVKKKQEPEVLRDFDEIRLNDVKARA